MIDPIKTPAQIADEARQTSEAQSQGAGTVQALRPAAADARAMGRDALDTAKGLASDARAIASDAWNTARSYARNAGGATGEKLGGFKVKAADLQQTAARRIADEPLKAVAVGAAAGALLAALLMRRGRGRRNH